MKFTYLGHNGYLVEFGQITLLIDPWFYPAHLDGWFPFPNNMPLLDQIDWRKVTHLYISHEHADHFDRKFLEENISKEVKCLVPNFINKGMAKELRKLGFIDQVVLDHKEKYFMFTMYLDGFKNDSALLLNWQGFRYFNLNDCYLKLNECPENIDLFSYQYSLAMHYPAVYDFSEKVKEQKLKGLLNTIMTKVNDRCNHMNVKCFLPSAGPAVFLDQRLSDYDKFFPTWDKIKGYKADAQVHYLNPGATFYIINSMVNAVVNPEPYPETRVVTYKETNETIHQSEIDQHFKKLCTQHSHVVTKEPRAFWLQVGNDKQLIKLGNTTEANSTLFVPSKVMRSILDKKIGWEEAFGSMRIKIHREKDFYDNILFSLLNYSDSPVHTMKMMLTSDEKISREGFTFQRYCPHAGEDLTNATIVDGVIECKRHCWKWDLTTGQCVSGGSIKMDTKCDINLEGLTLYSKRSAYD